MDFDQILHQHPTQVLLVLFSERKEQKSPTLKLTKRHCREGVGQKLDIPPLAVAEILHLRFFGIGIYKHQRGAAVAILDKRAAKSLLILRESEHSVAVLIKGDRADLRVGLDVFCEMLECLILTAIGKLAAKTISRHESATEERSDDHSL